MNSKELRQSFLNFFEEKGHKIIPSAPIVVKNDPTLMFTNAGMNQFKNVFLGNSPSNYTRIANSQKCLRVSGKHNDLEEVGLDTYHHTMFEMLGSWSFNDYFKQDSIDWAWEFLTKICRLDEERLYITIFQGDKKDNISKDKESLEAWSKHVPNDRIISFGKLDNFWEMGDSGPCGPCSEIHYDNRTKEERSSLSGRDLVNQNHPEVIEIWNLVFIEYSRDSKGSLSKLPDSHVDTGMGFERLCMIMQSCQSNYDTDLFKPILNKISIDSNTKYGVNENNDIAMRVISDHLRAVCFSISDGQLPSNTKAGYVIRRILRRAVRYGYTYLKFKKPFLYRLVDTFTEIMSEQFCELSSQSKLIKEVIKQEEESFFKTLEDGLRKIDLFSRQNQAQISGAQVFELYDTFGFPVDLTKLILNEKGLSFDMKEFENCMQKQKNRSKGATKLIMDDWITVHSKKEESFIGYNKNEQDISINRYRKVKSKDNEFYQLVFDKTPFYPEGGGQVGEKGCIVSEIESIEIYDTKKENDLILHFTKKLPKNLSSDFIAKVDIDKRKSSSRNHSATHLLHESLREILGNHIEQKGSLVEEEYLRFDFNHFNKVSSEDIDQLENLVNKKILNNLSLEEFIDLDINEAKQMGAMMLFGEKYNETVRMIQFGTSKELCGGTHVQATGEIGIFKIINETSIASGIRRIEALTGKEAFNYLKKENNQLVKIKEMLKSQDPIKGIEKILFQNKENEKIILELKNESFNQIVNKLKSKIELINNINVIVEQIDVSKKDIKSLCMQLRKSHNNLIAILINAKNENSFVAACITDDLIQKEFSANDLIQKIGQLINVKGGGGAPFSIAGGAQLNITDSVISNIKSLI